MAKDTGVKQSGTDESNKAEPALGLYVFKTDARVVQLVTNTGADYSIYVDSNGVFFARPFEDMFKLAILIGDGMTLEGIRSKMKR